MHLESIYRFPCLYILLLDQKLHDTHYSFSQHTLIRGRISECISSFLLSVVGWELWLHFLGVSNGGLLWSSCLVLLFLIQRGEVGNPILASSPTCHL